MRRLRKQKTEQERNDNVTEAAMLTGFNHMAHFREIFKNEFGILPSDVKKGDKV